MNCLRYVGLSSIRKDEELKGLNLKLQSLCSGNHNFYIEDKKLGLIKLSDKNGSLLPVSSPTRNQLLVVIIESIDQ
jgi:hypothetical protein